jgi:hypothetical protein
MSLTSIPPFPSFLAQTISLFKLTPLDQVIAMVFEEGRARYKEEVAAAAK